MCRVVFDVCHMCHRVRHQDNNDRFCFWFFGRVIADRKKVLFSYNMIMNRLMQTKLQHKFIFTRLTRKV